MNGRSCFCTKEDRTTPKDCRDHSLLRRKEQTNIIGKQILDEAEARGVDCSKLRTHYGCYEKKCMFEGCDVDAHIQGWWCPSHLLQYGVDRFVIGFLMRNWKPQQRLEFQIRLRDFPWPQGTSAPMSAVQAKFGVGFRMEDWRNTMVAAQFILGSLVTSNMIEFVVLLVRTNSTLRSGMTKEELRKVQRAFKNSSAKVMSCSELNGACQTRTASR